MAAVVSSLNRITRSTIGLSVALQCFDNNISHCSSLHTETGGIALGSVV